MHKTEINVKGNPQVKMVFSSKEVQGLWGIGAGFLAEGEANFLYEGSEFEMMRQKFSPIMNMTRVISITVNKLTQTL
jgi:hypothetical protein